MIILLVLFLVVNSLYPTRVGVLEEIAKPEMIQVEKNDLYVLEGAIIYKYSLKDLTLVSKFGKKGEGPGEMKVTAFAPNSFRVFPGYIFAESFDKVLFFKKGGSLIKEQKIPFLKLKVLPVKNNYVMKVLSTRNKVMYDAIKLYDAGLKEIKELYRQKSPIQVPDDPTLMSLIPDAVNFDVYDNRIYIENSLHGLQIHVFDENGKDLYTIKKDVKKIKVGEAHKKNAFDSLKESFLQKKVMFFIPSNIMEGGWDNFVKWAKFDYPDYLPAIQDLKIKGGKIYAPTFIRKDNKQEYLVMDLKGDHFQQKYFPIKAPTGFVTQLLGMGGKYSVIVNNQLIYLYDNEDEETWEIHKIPLN